MNERPHRARESIVLCAISLAFVVSAADAEVVFRGMSEDTCPVTFPAHPCPIAVPSPSVAEGDFLLAHVQWESQPGTTLTPDPGFTFLRDEEIASDFHSSLYYRVATAAEPATSTWDASENQLKVVIAAWSGVDPANPIDGQSGFVDPAPCPTSETLSLTTTKASSQLVFIVTADGGMVLSFPPEVTPRWGKPYGVLFGADEPLGPAGTYTRTATTTIEVPNVCPRRIMTQMIGLASRDVPPSTLMTTSSTTTTTIARKSCRPTCRTLRKACRGACAGTPSSGACRRDCNRSYRASTCRTTGSCAAP